MSILLFGAGALAFLTGVAMVGYGVPINEFSFGNTLIVSGTVAIVGGLVIAGLGAAVLYLQRIADALANNKAPVRAGRSSNAFEQPVGARPSAAPARVPFPPKVKAEPKSVPAAREPAGFESMAEPPFAAPSAPSSAAPSGMPFNEPGPDYFAPSLPNPDEPPVTVEDEVSLSPRDPMAPAAPAEFSEPKLPAQEGLSFSADEAEEEFREQKATRDAGSRSPPVTPPPGRPVQAAKPVQNAYFDAMWPAEPKADDQPPGEPSWESKPPIADETPEPTGEPAADEPVRDDESPAVAILKSGVVDGMGYTLYVDGSIEAELPQGTLRFASITELRQHLEKTA